MLPALRIALFAACLFPAAELAYKAYTGGDLGINPIETLTHETGEWALRLLFASLAITPIRRMTGWNRIITFRRPLGLFAFFYAVLHLSVWVVFDHYFTWSTMWKDIVKRPFITMGTLAFLLMLPLALTSTKGWIRRMGKRWTQLHYLVYPAAIAAMLHFIWLKKVALVGADETVIYGLVLLALLAIRVFFAVRRWRVARAA